MSNKIIRDNVVQGAIVSREWAEANAIDSTNFNKLYKLVYQPSLTLVDCTPGYTLDDDTSTEIYKVSQFMEDDAGGGGGGASNTSQLSVNDPVSESLGGTATEQNGVNMEVVTELRSLDTRLDAVEAGGGGASTTDQIATKGMTSGVADGTPLNTVLDTLNNYLIRVVNVNGSTMIGDGLRLQRSGNTVLINNNAGYTITETPLPTNACYILPDGFQPKDTTVMWGHSADLTEILKFDIQTNGYVYIKSHKLNGVDVPPGSPTQELYFNQTLITSDLFPVSETKPAPKTSVTSSSTSLIDTLKQKVVNLWKTLMQ